MTGLGLFPTVDPRILWLRVTLLAATLSGMLSCIPLWLSTREYPLVPISSSWPVLPPTFGMWFFGLTLASLVAALWFFRTAIAFFLAATLFLYGCDQNRGQPWMYLYWVLLLLSLFSDKTVLPACRLALALVYFWAGIQKLNGTFFTAIPAWFVQPAIGWGLPHVMVAGLRASVALTPLFEIFISAGIWFPKTRWLAIAIAAILHGAALVFLGPLGHNVNLVVWPWNIAMVALLVVLFGSKECTGLPQTLRELRRFRGVSLVLGLYALLPILSFFGCWDSYFSFALYSANLSKADLYVTQSFRERLPGRLQKYVDPVENYDPSFQLPCVFEHPRWAASELGVPELPEPRGYAVMFRYVAAYATNENDCRMVVETRGVKILLYRPSANPVVLHQ
jgi:hypothetical protein